MQENEYKCKYTDIEFKGKCPIQECPANISAKFHPSGCLFLFYNKENLGSSELAYVWETDTKYVKHLYNVGLQNIMKLVTLSNMIDKVRNNPFNKFCTKCGVIHTHSGQCINKATCKKRAKLAKRLLHSYPLKLPEYEASRSDIWLLFYYRNDLESEFKLEDLLELTQTQTNQISALSKKV